MEMYYESYKTKSTHCTGLFLSKFQRRTSKIKMCELYIKIEN